MVLAAAMRKANVSGSVDSDMRERRVIRDDGAVDEPMREPVSVNPAYRGASLVDVARLLMRPRNPAARATLERLQTEGS